MADLPRATEVARAGAWSDAADRVVLDYDTRSLRRKHLTAAMGLAFLADLPERASFADGDAFALDDGRFVEVVAADEPICAVTGNLAKLAWHIGACHVPCRVESTRLLIKPDRAVEAMLKSLGARVIETSGPFQPEQLAEGAGQLAGHENVQVLHHGAHHHLSDDDEAPDEE